MTNENKKETSSLQYLFKHMYRAGIDSFVIVELKYWGGTRRNPELGKIEKRKSGRETSRPPMMLGDSLN
jgi:hypothetical protein